jgi:hypothetical protein
MQSDHRLTISGRFYLKFALCLTQTVLLNEPELLLPD